MAASDLPDKQALLLQVARNPDLGAESRRQALLLLVYANVTESQPLLLAELSNAQPGVQAAAAKGLGWIGTRPLYEPLVTVMRGASSDVAKQAEWSARLVAHREGLAASELPELRTTDIVPFTSERQPVRIAPARPDRLRLCLDAVARRDFRLRFAAASAHEVQCARTTWMLLPTESAARNPASLLGRRSVAAAVALFIAEENSFSIARSHLSNPADGWWCAEPRVRRSLPASWYAPRHYVLDPGADAARRISVGGGGFDDERNSRLP